MSMQKRDAPCQEDRPGQTALYRFFDVQQRLLYVGITCHLKTRWAHHRLHAAETWWPCADTRTVEWFSQRSAAANAERTAIRTEAPLYNVATAPYRAERLREGEQLGPRIGLQRSIEAVAAATEGLVHPQLPLAVALTLEAEVRRGELAPGMSFPSLSSLASRFAVSANTIRAAVSILVEDAFLLVTGAGTARRYVVAEPPEDPRGWRPAMRLEDGREPVDALIQVMRDQLLDEWAAAKTLGINPVRVREWGYRHQEIRELVDEARSYVTRERRRRRTGLAT